MTENTGHCYRANSRTSRQLARPVAYSGSHQMRAPFPTVFVASEPSSARSVSRVWTQRRERGSSSVTSCVLRTGPSLCRTTARISSSLTVRGRPALPMSANGLPGSLNRPHEPRQESDVFKNKSCLGCNRESRSPRVVLTPARSGARGRLSTSNPRKATMIEAPIYLESTGSTSTDDEQTAISHLGFVPASQRRSDDLAREDQADANNQEGNR